MVLPSSGFATPTKSCRTIPLTTALITWPLTIQRSARLLTKSEVMAWQVPLDATVPFIQAN